MIINKSNAVMIYNKILETKEVSKLSFDEDKMVRYCHTLNVIASLKPRVNMLGDFEIKDYNVLNSMGELVVPRKISFEIGDDYADFRSSEYSEYKPENYGYPVNIQYLDADDFNAVTKGIAGSRKKSEKGVSLDTFSKEETISTVVTRLANLNNGFEQSFVAPQVHYYVPINSNVVPIKDEFQTQKASVCFRLWLQNALNKISSEN